jgi:hypothetical protein
VRSIAFLTTFVMTLFLAGAASAEDAETVVFEALDKETARISTFEAQVGETVSYQSLRITVRRCQVSAPEELPEDAAFVEVREVPVRRRDGETPTEPQLLFSGWMFSSNPALSALDHAIYDIWVKDCR